MSDLLLWVVLVIAALPFVYMAFLLLMIPVMAAYEVMRFGRVRWREWEDE